MDRDHHRSPCRDAFYDVTVRYRACGAAPDPARGHHCHGISDCDRLLGGRSVSWGCRCVRGLCVHGLRLDTDGSADGWIRAERRGALWPQLRPAATLGIGRFHRRRTGLRTIGRSHRPATSDLGDRGDGGSRGHRRSRTSADRRARSNCDRSGRSCGFAQQSRVSRHHPRFGARHDERGANHVSRRWRNARLAAIVA